MRLSFSELAALEVTRLLSPLDDLGTRKQLVAFIGELGWDVSEVLAVEYSFSLDTQDFALDLAEALGDVIKLAEASDEEAARIGISLAQRLPGLIGRAIGIAQEILGIIDDIRSDVPGVHVLGLPSSGEAAALRIARRVIDLLLYKYLRGFHPQVFGVSHLVGLIESVDDETKMPVKTVQWERLPQFLTSPASALRHTYQRDAAPEFDVNEFLRRLEVLLRYFLISGGFYRQGEAIQSKLNRADGEEREIRIPLFQDGVWPESYREIDLNLCSIPAKDSDNRAGIFVYPYLTGAVDFSEELSDNWDLTFRGNFESNPEVGVEVRPPAKLSFVSKLFDTADDLEEAADFQLELGIEKKAPKDQLQLIFGSMAGSRFGYREIGFEVMLGREGEEFAFFAEARLDDLTLVIDPGQGDGFVQKVLSEVVLEALIDLTLGVSSREGFYFRGSSELAVTVPIHRQLGPILIDSLKVGVGFGDEMSLLLAVTFGIAMGPIKGLVRNIGLRIPVKFEKDCGGNLGPLDIKSPRFVPPEGYGLALDSDGLKGAGFLRREEDLYSGIVELGYGEIAVTATGLIVTRMPDGSKGFSMVVSIGAVFTPPIALGFGFALAGVGGLLGVHRSVNTDFLREGLRARTLDSILFPEDPVSNAPKLLSDMGSAFPIAQDRFVIGPMVEITWADVISGQICILIEIPQPLRLVLLGQVVLALPPPSGGEPAVVRLTLDSVGVLEVAKKELAIDATLHDSRLVTYPLYGDAAMRLTWGDNANFALAVGGFHPRYTPPPRFPRLARLTISLVDSSNLSISGLMYTAVTANSIQIGKNLQIRARYSGASLDGDLTFDALAYYSPFSFTANMAGGVSVKYRGRSLASIELSLQLWGPTPWRAKGSARFKILRWKVRVRFDETWGDSRERRLPDVDPLPLLKENLEADSSWGSMFPGIGSPQTATVSHSDQKGIRLHPMAMPEVRQRVLPLALELDLFNNANVKDHKRFELRTLDIYEPKEDGTHGPLVESHSLSYLQEQFPRAPFFKVSEDQKLSGPSFEPMPGGVTCAQTPISVGHDQAHQAMEYENILIDSERVSRCSPKRLPLDWRNGKMRLANADRNVLFSGPSRYRDVTGEVAVRTQETSYMLVTAETLDVVDVEGNTGVSYTMAKQLLGSIDPSDEEVLILPVHELETARANG